MRINQLTQVSQLDFNTGELINEVTTKSFSLEKEPHFAKFYFKDLCDLNNLSASCHLVFFHLAEIMDYTTNEVIIIKSVKQKIANKIQGTVKLVEKCVNELYQKEFLFRTERSSYILNPKYITKGNWADVKKIEMTIVYTAKGKTLVTTFEPNE